jgi:micrococcal nuclease
MGVFFEQLVSILAGVFMFLGGLFGQFTFISVTDTMVSGTTTATVINVIDGDTIDVQIDGIKDPLRVRYIGIDTPEPYAEALPECGSSEATRRNLELVGNSVVTLVPGTNPYDKYDRLLAYVYVGDRFINGVLIAEGFATVMMVEPNTQYRNSFNNLYTSARTNKLGIWALCGSGEHEYD